MTATAPSPAGALRRRLASALIVVGVACGVLSTGGCSTNPATGQQAFTLLSQEDERKLGR